MALIERQKAINAMAQALWLYPNEYYRNLSAYAFAKGLAENGLRSVPSVQTETCEGCKHLGEWENEVEYGYPSPCTRCKRRVEDHYER